MNKTIAVLQTSNLIFIFRLHMIKSLLGENTSREQRTSELGLNDRELLSKIVSVYEGWHFCVLFAKENELTLGSEEVTLIWQEICRVVLGLFCPLTTPFWFITCTERNGRSEFSERHTSWEGRKQTLIRRIESALWTLVPLVYEDL